MNVYVSYNSTDCPGTEAVQVVASFNKKGDIAPLYVRFHSAVYKIVEYWVKSEKFHSVVFCCFIIKDDVRHEIELMYHDIERTWTARLRS